MLGGITMGHIKNKKHRKYILKLRYEIMQMLEFETCTPVHELITQLNCTDKDFGEALKFLKLNDFVRFDKDNNVALFDFVSFENYKEFATQNSLNHKTNVASIIAAIASIIAVCLTALQILIDLW